MSADRKWTVFVYADGNNDLEPEIYHRFQNMIAEPVSEDMTVIVQIARAPKELLQILRPNVSHLDQERWDGVRRYKMDHRGATLIDDLKNVNMANPYTLVDFLTWGVTNYPSNRRIVILSGHGAGFVGAMNDYTHQYPSIMSLKGIVKTFQYFQQQTGKTIDTLVLDACYMNSIEVWHEFACASGQPIRYLIAPMGNTPLSGLPCHLFIRYLRERNSQQQPLINTITDMVEVFNQNARTDHHVVAVNLLKKYFRQLKAEVDGMASLALKKVFTLTEGLAQWYDDRPNYPFISLLDLNDKLTATFSSVYPYSQSIPNILKHIVLDPLLTHIPKNRNLGPSLYLPATSLEYQNLDSYYNQLEFAHNNRWVQILNGNSNKNERFVSTKKAKDLDFSPSFLMPPTSMVSLIKMYNPNLSEDQILQIISKLGWQKPDEL